MKAKFFFPTFYILSLGAFFLTGCPSGNGHSPFDVLAGRSSIDDVLSDQGNSQGMILQKSLVSGSQTPNVTRGSSYTFGAYVKNSTGAAVTTTSVDKIQFFYCSESAFPNSMYLTGGGSSYGSFSNQQSITSTYFAVGASNILYPTTSYLTIPSVLTSGQSYYIGVQVTLSGKATSLTATTNVANLIKFAKISVF